MPSLKINYLYAIYETGKENKFTAHLNGGLLFALSGKSSGPSGDSSFFSSTFVDGGGNVTDSVFISQHHVATQQAGLFTPYLVIGIDGNILLNQRLSAGIELMGYAGYKNLYSETYTGKTQEAEFTYKAKILPYFFSAGIYLQYRIR